MQRASGAHIREAGYGNHKLVHAFN